MLGNNNNHNNNGGELFRKDSRCNTKAATTAKKAARKGSMVGELRRASC